MRIIPIINNQNGSIDNPKTNRKSQPSFKNIYHIETIGKPATEWLSLMNDKFDRLQNLSLVKKVVGGMSTSTTECLDKKAAENGDLLIQINNQVAQLDKKVSNVIREVLDYIGKHPEDVTMTQIHTGSDAIDAKQMQKITKKIKI